ncbi:hypothetical protein BWI17_20950 [Betaproteobacteria bacterium GR16-43]|nr:hypothetical protein BWI17_20950 [Betaproteobacteria bacterium GR16-43]
MKRASLLVNIGLAALVTGSLVYAAVDNGPRATLMAPRVYDAALKQIERDANKARMRCASLNDYEARVCGTETEAKRRVQVAELDARYLGTVTAAWNARAARLDAEHEVEQTRCTAFSGEERGACEKIAKHTYSAAVQALGKPA